MVTETDVLEHIENKIENLVHTENRIGDNVRVDSEIVCRENKSEYRYINNAKQRVAKIKVDGGLVPSKHNTIKCDYLVINWDSATSFFIELKGSDVRKAISQIIATLGLLWSDISGMGICVAHARIVPTKHQKPDIIHNQQRQLEQMLKKCNGKPVTKPILIQSNRMIEAF